MTAVHAGEARSEIQTGRMENFGRVLLGALRRQRVLFLTVTLSFPILFNLLLFAILVGRFGHLPNYVLIEDWIGNVARIVASTGSVSDILSIVMDEWVLEIGYMNYAFGHGVSEWSLLVIPHKLLMVLVVGALIGVNCALVADQEPVGNLWQQSIRSMRSGLVMSVGTLFASLSSVTLFWVICHSGPSWVVSLAVLGVDAPTALRLDPLGPALFAAGVAVLLLSALLAFRDGRMDAAAIPSRRTTEAASC
jgi:hypothetical protein